MAFHCLFHLHTRHSFDSLLPPAKILKSARERDIAALIVTDHNTIAGAREAQALARGDPKFVVIAAEYATDKGDLIGLFLKEEIRARRSDEVIEQIHAQGGLVVLPHPHRAHQLDDTLLAGIDMVEVHNSRCSARENATAAALAARLGRPALGGADAHCGAELGSVINTFEAALPADERGLRETLLNAPRRIESRSVSRAWVPYSQMIKAVKTRNALLFARQIKRLAVAFTKESLQRSAESPAE